MKLTKLAIAFALLALGLPLIARAADEDLRKELDRLKKDLDSTKGELEAVKKKSAERTTPIASASASVEAKYGPNAAVTTKAGKLTIGGLVQVWYYSIQDDNTGFFGDRPGSVFANGANRRGDTNEMKDNDGFAIRRAEIKFTMDIHENVSAVVMIDPARAIKGLPSFPTNVGLHASTVDNGLTANDAAVRDGESSATANNAGILQDAYINYHGVVPHHDFTIGQHRKFLGEEGIRNDANLDFIERSMIAQTYTDRDLGLTVHGSWWDDRFQYWLGAFNDAGNWFGTAGSQQNRVDDNDEKSFVWRALVRPLWKNETWGSLELGASGEHSIHGEAGNPGNPSTGATTATAGTVDVDGLDRKRTNANRYYAWASYRPGGPVRGWWLKGEWGMIMDRNAPGTVAAIHQTLNPGTAGVGFLSNIQFQRAPNPTSLTGFSFATGYRISESVWKDSAPGWLKNFEFAFRYEQFENVMVADLIDSNIRTDVFATDVWTAGINYYIKGDNAKIQINYNVVDNPDAGSLVTRGYSAALGANHYRRNFDAVDNNSLVVNFQVAW